MPAHRVVAEAQERALLDAMWENLDIARGRVSSQGGPSNKITVSQFWQRLASRLNAMCSGTIKDGNKWRYYWTDRKCQVKKKASALRQHASGTGGGPAKKSRLTDVEEEILQIIGRVNAYGEPSPSPAFSPSLANIQQPAAAPQPQEAAQQQRELVLPAPVEEQGPANFHSQDVVEQQLGDVQRPAIPELQEVVQQQLAPPLTPPNNARNPMRPTNRQAMEERLSISAPQWALDLERQRLETERDRATAATRMAEAIERLAQAAENQTGMLRLLLEEMRAQRGA